MHGLVQVLSLRWSVVTIVCLLLGSFKVRYEYQVVRLHTGFQTSNSTGCLGSSPSQRKLSLRKNLVKVNCTSLVLVQLLEVFQLSPKDYSDSRVTQGFPSDLTGWDQVQPRFQEKSQKLSVHLDLRVQVLYLILIAKITEEHTHIIVLLLLNLNMRTTERFRYSPIKSLLQTKYCQV